MEIKELTNDQFNKFTSLYQLSSLYQTVPYALVMNKQNYDCMYLGMYDGNTIYAATLLLIEKKFRAKYAYAPRGFLIDYTNDYMLTRFTTLIKDYLKKKKVIAVKINPMVIKSIYNPVNVEQIENTNYQNIFTRLQSLGYKHCGYNNFFEGLKPRFEAIIKLNNNPNEVFKHITKSFKTKIRGADTDGIRIYKGNIDNLNYLYLHTKSKYPRNLDYFKNIYEQFDRSNNVDFYYAKINTETYLRRVQIKYQKQQDLCVKYNDEVFRKVGKNNDKEITKKIKAENLLAEIKNELIYATKLLKDYPEGIVLASALIIKNQDEVYLLMDGFNPKYKNFNAKHLLIWKLIERYCKLGFKKFNLGGMSNINIPNVKYKGLNEFKINFGADIVEYIGDLEFVINKTIYKLYKNVYHIKKILKK